MPVKKPVAKKENKEEVIKGEIVLREAPVQRVVNEKDIILPAMNAAQMRILINQTPKWAVKVRQGKGGRTFKYVPHGYVADQLNKAFGFDWDLLIDPMANGNMYALELEPLYDPKGVLIRNDRHIAVCGRLVVRVRDKNGKLVTAITKSGFGSQMWLPTMEFGDALKAARSDLVKTCAFQLGIALDLYYNEKAEFDTFVEREAVKSASQQMAEQLATGIPDSPVLFLSRAMSDYNLDGMEACEICGTSIDELMAMNAEQIGECWKALKKHATKK